MGYTPYWISIKDGDHALNTTSVTTTFAGGAPVKVSAGTGAQAGIGVISLYTASAVTDRGYVGVAKVSRSAMAVNGVATYLHGASKGEMYDNSANVADDGKPYDTGVTWVIGDLMYVSTGGVWTNSQAASTGGVSAARGIVMDIVGGTAGVNPDKLIVLLGSVVANSNAT